MKTIALSTGFFRSTPIGNVKMGLEWLGENVMFDRSAKCLINSMATNPPLAVTLF